MILLRFYVPDRAVDAWRSVAFVAKRDLCNSGLGYTVTRTSHSSVATRRSGQYTCIIVSVSIRLCFLFSFPAADGIRLRLATHALYSASSCTDEVRASVCSGMFDIYLNWEWGPASGCGTCFRVRRQRCENTPCPFCSLGFQNVRQRLRLACKIVMFRLWFAFRLRNDLWPGRLQVKAGPMYPRVCLKPRPLHVC